VRGATDAVTRLDLGQLLRNPHNAQNPQKANEKRMLVRLITAVDKMDYQHKGRYTAPPWTMHLHHAQHSSDIWPLTVPAIAAILLVPFFGLRMFGPFLFFYYMRGGSRLDDSGTWSHCQTGRNG
jgi:hypothetical protein